MAKEMSDRDSGKLRLTIREVIAKIHRFKDRALGEQNTKASLIEPILEAIGWDVRDPDEVHREYKPTSKDSPVDYALASLHDMKLFVEAKGLGENLSDRKWAGQILGYAAVAGVEWVVLTDGDEYRFYNATAAVDADEKLLFATKLSEAKEDEAVSRLNLISRSSLGENRLNEIWLTHFVDRRVKDCLRRMMETRDKGLIRLIRKRIPKLQPKEIAQSLRRLEFRIESPADSLEQTKTTPTALPSGKPKKDGQKADGRKGSGKKAADTRKILGQVTLQSLIDAGLLKVPLRLFRAYKGHALEATLLPGGKVEFQGSTYDTCSTAAEQARGSVTGRRMNTNGWTFWLFVGENGRKQMLDDVRQLLLASLDKKSVQKLG